MKFHQIRNATAIIHYAGKKILIDRKRRLSTVWSRIQDPVT